MGCREALLGEEVHTSTRLDDRIPIGSAVLLVIP